MSRSIWGAIDSYGQRNAMIVIFVDRDLSKDLKHKFSDDFNKLMSRSDTLVSKSGDFRVLSKRLYPLRMFMGVLLHSKA